MHTSLNTSASPSPVHAESAKLFSAIKAPHSLHHSSEI